MKAICVSHPNIALVKYWGKENPDEITPIHGSLSVTLDFGETQTVAEYSDDGENHFELNGEKAKITKRLQNAISFFDDDGRKKFRISSKNSFPTAAGFASSASGAAAFVGAIASLCGETENPIEYWAEKGVDLSKIARKVSGSGCRSVYGGFVEWIPGNPNESLAKQVFGENHWEDLVAFAVVLNDEKKGVSSTRGMQESVETVPWIIHRAKNVVPQRITDAKECIATKNFKELSEIIMRESNELHANCLATYPPIKYLNEKSWTIIKMITDLNEKEGENICAYTFDAGPNPFIFTTNEHKDRVFDALKTTDVDIKEIITTKPDSGIVCKLIK